MSVEKDVQRQRWELMDLFTFIAAMSGHLAWPIVVFLALVIFRADVRQVIRRIASFKKGDLEIGLEKEMKTIEAEVAAEKVKVIEIEAQDSAPQVPEPKTVTPAGWQRTVLRVGESSPVAAILLAWTVVEQELYATAKRLGMPEDRAYRSPREVARWIEKHSDTRLSDLINHLSHVRNKLAHMPEEQISARDRDVEIYLDGAETIIAGLSKLNNDSTK